MYLHLFLLLFSSGASSYFIPLKETLHLQNKAKYPAIDEILCLLEAENESIKGTFSKPLHIQKPSCAHFNTKQFIHQLNNTTGCMKIIKIKLQNLKESCSILKKSSSNDESCSDMAKTSFKQFKESLKKFLEWVNEKQDCSNIVTRKLDLYLDSKCTCPHPWKYGKGFF